MGAAVASTSGWAVKFSTSSPRMRGPIIPVICCCRRYLTPVSDRQAAAYGSARSRGRRMKDFAFKRCKHDFAISRLSTPEVLLRISSTLLSEGAGNTGRRSAAAIDWVQAPRSHRDIRHSPRSGLYGCSVISPAMTVPPSLTGLTASLTPASRISGPYDLTVRFGIARLARRHDPPQPIPTFVTFAKRPSEWNGMARNIV